MIYDIRIFPDPILKKVARYVDFKRESIKEFCGNLIETMEDTPHSVGLAAPQVGKLLRVIVVDASRNRKGKRSNHGQLIMINPIITYREGEQTGREGCMSIPDYFGVVTRAGKIRVEYLDLAGNDKTLETKQYESIVIQHEIDHLDGYLFLDRITSLKHDLHRRQQ